MFCWLASGRVLAMARSRAKTKGRSDKERFTGIPHAVMKHQDWLNLSPNAIRLLIELAMQYNGRNNGDLTAAWTIMKERGFKSQSTLHDAVMCLLELRMLIRTREGRFCNPGKRCALYALTWQPIDECPGKQLEVGHTRTPPRQFSIENKKPSPQTGLIRYGNWIDTEVKLAEC